jgi:hypothetical protein
MQCTNNLKQFGLGLHNYHDANGGFPPGKIEIPKGGTVIHTWTPYVLPYIEQDNLYRQYRFDKSWDDAATNDANPGGVGQTELKLTLCPSAPTGRRGSRNRAVIDYSPANQITRPNPAVNNMPPSDPTFIGILGHNVQRRITEITDGTSNTILLAEDGGRNQKWVMGKMVASSGGTGAWLNPGTEVVVSGWDVTNNTTPGACAVNCTNNNEIYGFHPAGVNILLGDGSVRILRAQTDINVVIALVTRAMGEVIPSNGF